ncbi:MAG: protein-tyrosine-phosphatase [Flavobacteriaceae bacterium]|nr:protein-tyrosine-phosphatase [Flavobacteriaceae bacterium]
MFSSISSLITRIDNSTISDQRKELLKPLKEYLSSKIKQKSVVNLNFICTHNSRRSQLSEVWAKIIGDFYGLNINTFSGGIEITSCNERTINSLSRLGFKIKNLGGENPHYEIKYADNKKPITLFSKLYDDPANPKTGFAAVMSCSHADENCPFIPGAEKRISLPYEDPKAYDNTADEAKIYDERSIQIATEMKYVFGGLLD